MPTRKNIGNPNGGSIHQPDRLQTGYQGSNIPDDFHIPACGIGDVDRAFFNLFDKDINFTIVNRGTSEKVPVIFATGERFAIIKKEQPVRDDAGRVIIPLISIRRTSIDQSTAATVPGPRADVGEVTIKRRLSSKDPRYQSLVNKTRLRNQDNVASPENVESRNPARNARAGKVGSRRPEAEFVGDTYPGYSLKPDLGKNIFEIITVPNPTFFSISYEVVFWTNYVTHMNQLIETLMSSYSPSGSARHEFKITSDKGYYFIAFVDNTLTNADNFDDFTDQERIVRYTLNFTVTGYLIAPQNPGDPSPFRKFLSAPDVSFEMFQVNAPLVGEERNKPPVSGDVDDFILQDIEDIGRDGNVVDSDRRTVEKVRNIIKNPVTGENEVEILKVLSRNERKGESVVKARIIKKLGDI